MFYHDDNQAATNKFDYDKVEIKEPDEEGESDPDEKTEVSISPSLDLKSIFDFSNGKFSLVDELGSLLEFNIDDINFNFDDHSYTINTYNTTYNTENNYYEYNYYTYNVQYTYNNTYVTYVGSTAEYQPKEWSLYYQLPDGRSSADLTEEDVAGLSFQFQDVINYKRASTSADLWALYHFDGNTDDDSYYTKEDSFSWQQGASINYMEANAFGGALYLDEQPHQFTLAFPSGLGTRDFTLQWRYYQNSATTSENADNYITAGGKELLRWSEKNLYLSGSSTPCTNKLSVGSWQELALVRSGGTLYLYHNGVVIAQTPISNALGKELVFSLGGSSRAYSMLDELRLITKPIAVGGKSYTPTAVPYDSNSVLVLPGESVVTDSYYKWDTTRPPLWSFDVEKDMKVFQEFGDLEYGDSKHFDIKAGEIYTVNSPNVISDGSLLTLSAGSSAWDYGFQVDPSLGLIRAAGNYANASHPGFLITLSGVSTGYNSLFPGQQAMALTFVGADLERYTMVLDAVASGKHWTSNYDWGTITVQYHEDYSEDTRKAYVSCDLVIQPKANSSFSFRYAELVPGSTPNTGHQLVTDTYNTADLKPNTAAVQTDIPIKGYTVGGVRPTFPSRGDVWFPAEGNRISGVQVYNGQAWEETNARWWTGKRWIPIYAFDLVTLADMWDVGSSTGEDVTPTITTEKGFWNWWKNTWNAFTEKLFSYLDKLGVPVPPAECEHKYKEQIVDQPTCMLPGSAMYTCYKCGDNYTDSIDPLGHDWVMKDSVPDETPTQVVNITDRCTVTVPNFTEYADLIVDGDPNTFWSSATGDYPCWVYFTFPEGQYFHHMEVEFEHYEGRTWDFWVRPYENAFQDGSPAGNCYFQEFGFSANDVFASGRLHNGYLQKCVAICIGGTNAYAWPGLAEVRIYAEVPGDETIPGYDLYVCSVCGEEYKNFDRNGPPGSDEFLPDEDDDWSVWDLLKALKDGSWAIVKGVVKTAFGGIKGVIGVVADIGGFFTTVGEVSDTIKDFGG